MSITIDTINGSRDIDVPYEAMNDPVLMDHIISDILSDEFDENDSGFEEFIFLESDESNNDLDTDEESDEDYYDENEFEFSENLNISNQSYSEMEFECSDEDSNEDEFEDEDCDEEDDDGDMFPNGDDDRESFQEYWLNH